MEHLGPPVLDVYSDRRLICSGTTYDQACAVHRAQAVVTKALHGKRTRFTFHAEDLYASGRHKRPRGPRSSLKRRIVASTPPSPCILSLEQEAYNFFLLCHLQSIDNSVNSSKRQDSLVTYVTHSRTKLLATAVSSLSLALFAQSRQLANPVAKAKDAYTLILKQLQPALVTLKPGQIENCLLVISFMGLYEDAMYEDDEDGLTLFEKLRSARHHDGLLALLKVWSLVNSDRSASAIIKHARRACLKAVLFRRKLLPDWLRDGERFGESGLDLNYDRIMVRTLTARQNVQALAEIAPDAQHVQLFNDLRDVDVSLQSWTLEFPADTRPCPKPLSQLFRTPNPSFFTNTVHIYPTSSAAAVWVKYFATRLLLSEIRIYTLQLAFPEAGLLRDTCAQELSAIINTAALGLACTLPFILGRVRMIERNHQVELEVSGSDVDLSFATGLITPLAIASGLRHVDSSLRKWLKSQLAQLGHSLGYGLLQSAERRSWTIF